MPIRRALLLPLLALVLVLTSACGLSGFTSGDNAQSTGAISAFDPAERSEPVSLSGTTLEGKPFDLASTRGKVTVVNLWGAWCEDCIKEAPDIAAAHRQLGAKVAFLGLDVGDSSKAKAISFQRGNHLGFPSIYSPDGAVLLAFPAQAGLATLDSVPGTAILDKEGRVAAVIHSTTPSTLTLVELVHDVERGKSDA